MVISLPPSSQFNESSSNHLALHLLPLPLPIPHYDPSPLATPTLSSVHPHWSPVTLTEQTSHEITNHFWHSTCPHGWALSRWSWLLPLLRTYLDSRQHGECSERWTNLPWEQWIGHQEASWYKEPQGWAWAGCLQLTGNLRLPLSNSLFCEI